MVMLAEKRIDTIIKSNKTVDAFNLLNITVLRHTPIVCRTPCPQYFCHQWHCQQQLCPPMSWHRRSRSMVYPCLWFRRYMKE